MQRPTANEADHISAPDVSISDIQAVHPPETPTISDTLTALRKSIEDIVTKETLDYMARERIKKLGNAAEKAFADRSILLGENDELFKQNHEKEKRASTKATKVASARIMQYEVIVEEQRLREEKERQKRTNAGRRGVKRKQFSLSEAQNRPKNKPSERAETTLEIKASGLEQYCTVIEF